MVTDDGFPNASATFDLKIQVQDANDAPYNLMLSGNFSLFFNVIF